MPNSGLDAMDRAIVALDGSISALRAREHLNGH
jgi:hypothetical protein